MIGAGLDATELFSSTRDKFEAQLQATLNLVPAYAWYALGSGALTFVNERSADYLGLPKNHPTRLFPVQTPARTGKPPLFCMRMIAGKNTQSLVGLFTYRLRR